jgi:AbrB family looped-hinge helix DNA binding protein
MEHITQSAQVDSMSITVKINKKHQINIPPHIWDLLNVKSGDKLLLNVQDGMMILLPEPDTYTDHLAGLHREIWDVIDIAEYVDQERDSWEHRSSNSQH